jgi:hypothetical protein
LFWSHHLQHLGFGRNNPVRLKPPEALMGTTSMIFHEFLDIFEHSEGINKEKTDLETLTHLQLILVWKILHQP